MTEGTMLRYGARIGETAVLGPGKRAVIWVYGCCFDCPGCIAPAFRNGPWQEARPEEMAQWYLAQRADGLTISGGEPMLQAGALAETVERIRAERDCGVIVYTGFVYEDLLERSREDRSIGHFLSLIDLLIDGPYVAGQDHNEPYRGSANQRLIPLTDRYRDDLDGYYGAVGRPIEIHLSERGTLMVGVPGKDQAEIWQRIKELGGERHDI